MSSSDPPFPPKEAFRPWTLPEVGSGKSRSQALDASKEKIRMPTANEIEALRQAAMEEGRSEGHEAGYEQGRREALESTRSEVEKRLQRLDEILSTLDQPLAELDEEVEQALVSLAIAIARQLVRRELRTDPTQIVGVIREAIAVLPSRSRNIKIYLHPEDVSLVEEAYGHLGGEPEWRLESDTSLSRGGCRVVTDVSRIDASLERRLASIIAPLLNEERSDEAETSVTDATTSQDNSSG